MCVHGVCICVCVHMKQLFVTSTVIRTFHLRLFPRQGLFEPGLTVTVVGAHGSSRQHPLDPSQFYSGELVGKVIFHILLS